MRGLPAMAFCVIALSPGQASADASGLREIETFVSVCPAALLAADTLAPILDGAGLTSAMEWPMGSTTVAAYANADGTQTLSITTQHFSDAIRQNCVLAVLAPLDAAAVEEVRRRLEANPLLGLLEGEVVQFAPGNVSGFFKKPGVSPLVAASVNASRAAATLTLETWTPTAAH